MERYLVPSEGPNTKSIDIAIKAAVKKAREIDCEHVHIITSVKKGLETNVVGKYLGRDVAMALSKGDGVPIKGLGISLVHDSVSTACRNSSALIGVALHVSIKNIEKLENVGFVYLVYVPWLNDEGIHWAQKWDVQAHGSIIQGAEVELTADVIAELQGLTKAINLSTGLAHPSDKERAVTLFKKLKSKKVTWVPEEVDKWAVRNGWSVRDATELTDLSRKYL